MSYCINMPVRNQYLVRTSQPKVNNTPLTADDYVNVGYMAGRFGVNLMNPNDPGYIQKDNNGLYVDINSCCAPLFESTLAQSGIKFDRIV